MDYFELAVRMFVICTAIMSAISLGLSWSNSSSYRELNEKLPRSWNSDYFDICRKNEELQDQIIALKDCIDNYREDYMRYLDMCTNQIVKAVCERETNTCAHMATILGDHKIEHDDLDKSIEIFTKAVSLAANDIGDVRDDLQIISSNLKDEMESYIRMNTDRVEINTPNFEIDEKVSDSTNESVFDKNQEI